MLPKQRLQLSLATIQTFCFVFVWSQSIEFLSTDKKIKMYFLDLISIVSDYIFMYLEFNIPAMNE